MTLPLPSYGPDYDTLPSRNSLAFMELCLVQFSGIFYPILDKRVLYGDSSNMVIGSGELDK